MKDFKLIGISARTINKDNRAAMDIGRLWARFYDEGIFEKVPQRTGTELYVIYTDYAGDYQSSYTTIIGVSVSSLKSIPEGLIGWEFAAEVFEKYNARGPIPECIVATWQGIWSRDKVLRRKYTYDMEIYDHRSLQGNESEVDVYVAVEQD